MDYCADLQRWSATIAASTVFPGLKGDLIRASALQQPEAERQRTIAERIEQLYGESPG